MVPILLVCGAALLCVYIREKIRAYSVKALILKALVSTLFVSLAVYGAWRAAVKGSVSPLCPFVVLGLLFGLLGDIWLDLKFCYEADNDFYTKMGFLSFAIGHVFYCAGVVNGVTEFKPVAILPAAGVAVVAALVVYFGEKAMKLKYGAYKLISTLYGAVLFFMAAFAFFAALFAGLKENMNLVVMAIGGVLFVLSDLILSGTYFGEGKNRPVDVVTNHVTYYIAQFLIASSVLFIK